MDEENNNVNNENNTNDTNNTNSSKGGNETAKGILSYVFGWLAGLIVLYGVKDNTRTTKLHAAQAIVLSVGYMAINFILSIVRIPYVGKILPILYLVVVVLGIVKVINPDQDQEFPLLGDAAKSIFGKKIDE